MNGQRSTLFYLFLFGIVTLGCFIRFSGLSTLGLGFDEPIHIYAAKSLLETGTTTLPSGVEYNRALLFTYIVAASFKLFGVNEFAARLPSVLFGIFSIILVFLVARRFFGREVALIASLLMAVAPFEIAWSRACRMYSIYQFAYLSCVISFYNGLEGRKRANPILVPGSAPKNLAAIIADWNLNWGWLILSGISFVIAFRLQAQVMIFGIGVFAYCLLMSILRLFTKGLKELLRSKYFLLCAIMLIGISVMCLIPSISRLIIRMQGFAPQWSKHMGISATRYFFFLGRPEAFFALVFFLLGSIQMFTRLDKFGIYSFSLVSVSLLIHSFLVNVQGERYIYDVFPLVIVLASFAMYSFWHDQLARIHKITEQFTASSAMAIYFRIFMTITATVIFLPIFSYAIKTTSQIIRNKPVAVGGEFHAQWKPACEYVNEQSSANSIFVASIPLAAEFSGCKDVQYKLDNGGLEQFRRLESGSRFLGDPFSSAKTIINLEDLKWVIAENRSGWIMIDTQRFNSPSTIPLEIREYITENLKKHSTPADETINVFSWDRIKANSATLK